MSGSRGGFGTIELARFFGRAWQVRLAGILIAATVLFVIAGASVASSLQLTPQQRADAILGQAGARIQLPGSAPLGVDGRALDRALVANLTAAGARNVQVDYIASGLNPDNDRAVSMIYEEFDQRASVANRLQLRSGTWPVSAGEALVSVPDASRWPIGSTVTFFDGTLRVRVVGTVLNRFSTGQDEVVAGPGTWESLRSVSHVDAERLAESAGRMVRWSGGASDAVVAAKVKQTVDADPSAKAAVEASGGISVQTRVSIEDVAPAPNVPLAVAGVAGPLIAGLIGGILAGAFIRRTREIMWEIGIAFRHTRSAALLALAVVAALGSLVGVLLGTGIGLLARVPLAGLATQELGPASVNPGWLGAVPLAVVGALAGVLVVRGRSATSATGVAAARESSMTLAIVRVCVGVVLASIGVFLGTGTTDIAQMSIAALVIAFAIVLIFAPFVLGFIARFRPGSFSVRLAIRTVGTDTRQVSIVVIAIASLQVLAFTLSILLTSSIAAVNNNVESQVPPGQIVLAPELSSAATTIVKQEFEAKLGLRDPVVEYASGVGDAREDGGTLILASPAALSRLVGRPLTSAESALLVHGGTLVTKSLRGNAVAFPRGGGFPGALVPAAQITNIDASFLNDDGFILSSTADADHLPLVDKTFVYTNVRAATESRASAVASELHLNSDWVHVYRAPDQLTAPLQVSAIVVILALVAGIIMLFSCLAQARALRPQISGLQALGVGPGFIRKAIVTRTGITFAVSTAFGVVASSIAVAVALHLADLTFGITLPAIPIVVMIAALFIFTALAALLATRRVGRTEWQGA